MSSRARALALGIAALVLLELGLWLGYRALVPAEGAARQAELTRSDDSRTSLDALGAQRPVLLHFWATWCAPCRRELPALLALAEDPSRPAGLGVVLVSLDEEWGVVRDYFGGSVPRAVVRSADGSLPKLFEVSALPDTFLLSADGQRLARFAGERAWTSAAQRTELERALARGR